MSRIWKVPSAIAEYTVGTAIVLIQLSLAKTIERQQAQGTTDNRRVVRIRDHRSDSVNATRAAN